MSTISYHMAGLPREPVYHPTDMVCYDTSEGNLIGSSGG